MTRRHVEARDFSGVAPNQVATVSLDPAGTYHRLGLGYNTATVGGPTRTNMEAEIGLMRLRIDGKTQREATAVELFTLNSYRGIPVRDGVLPWYFSPPWARTPQGEDQLAWHMSDVSTFQVEVPILAATSPALDPIVTREPNRVDPQTRQVLPMGPILKWRRYTLQASAAGVVQWNDLPSQDSLVAIHFLSALVTAVDIRRQQEEWWDLTLAQSSDYLAEQGFSPQANTYHVDFAATGRVIDTLPLRNADRTPIRDLRIDVTVSGAGAIPIIAETLGIRD